MNNASLVLHLFYEKPSIYLLDKVSKFYNGDNVYISLIKDAPHNNYILRYAKKYFKNIIINTEENRGSDQYGLFRLFNKYEDELNQWVFYFHDKHESKLDWIDALVDPFIDNKDVLHTTKNCGIIVSNAKKFTMQVTTEEDVIRQDEDLPKRNRITSVRSRHTLIWIRELQYILHKETGILDTDNINFEFVAGNMFCIKKPVLKLALSCVDDTFFETLYRPDGDIGHGLERFYFYVNSCLKYNLYKIGVKNEEI